MHYSGGGGGSGQEFFEGGHGPRKGKPVGIFILTNKKALRGVKPPTPGSATVTGRTPFSLSVYFDDIILCSWSWSWRKCSHPKVGLVLSGYFYSF